jgi:hypothetical protein
MEEALETKEHMEHLEHASNEDPKLGKLVAVTTSILALLAAFTALQAESYFSKAIMSKNEAIMKQNGASDTWAHFQSKSMKMEFNRLAILLKGDHKTSASHASGEKAGETEADKIARYEKDKEEISAEAKKLEAERDELNHHSEHFLHLQHGFASTLTIFQVAIVLSTISLIVRRRSVYGLGTTVGLIGLVYLVISLLAARA